MQKGRLEIFQRDGKFKASGDLQPASFHLEVTDTRAGFGLARIPHKALMGQ